MKKFFAPNISRSGRLLRAMGGLLLVGGGLVACSYSLWLSFPLIVSGGFVLYEASRGWCLLRACGIRTRL